MIQKLLCIVGPTGTGKTGLAVHLSKMFSSTLISADSRQVYRGMDVVTGKDHPRGQKLWGIDLVDPDEECSVAVWHDAVRPALHGIDLPLIVGGTGLYVHAMTEGIKTIHIPPDPKLRRQLSSLSLTELQDRLTKVAPAKLTSMNQSDRNNPRRLIRAIEISLAQPLSSPLSPHFSSLLIGLKYFDDSNHQYNIRARVIDRLDNGALDETKTLLEKYSPQLPSLTAIGYRSLNRYIKGELTESQMVEKWTEDELAYAKRQMTWFNKVPNIQWFDAQDSDLAAKIAKLVTIWYASS